MSLQYARRDDILEKWASVLTVVIITTFAAITTGFSCKDIPNYKIYDK